SAIAPIRRRPKKRNAEPRQNSKYRQSVIDPLVNPGSPPHRHQARPKADPTRTHHRMVTLAQSSPGRRSTCPLQKTTTVMLKECWGHMPTNPAGDTPCARDYRVQPVDNWINKNRL